MLILALVAAIFLTVQPTPPAYADESGARKAVLVTGSSSGIGLKITERLSANGFYVYAGARKAADLERLDAMDNVSSVRLDVTVQDEIDAAVRFVRDQERGLYGVVNNAGVSAFSPLTSGPESDMDFVFNVNVYGPYRINKAFLPLLEESGGRTTTIGSIAGFSGTSGIYSMSKFAVEAYTDSLAREIDGNGVHVSVVQRARYENEEARRATRMEPDPVADAILELLTTENPKRRYLVTPNERQAHGTIKAAMRRVVQLNHDQPYAYDRGGLIAVLDELIEEVGND
jgi:NAD(P)-dependent dehydrogenase (short-subunit alcohol dehydrogenase family)